MLVICVFCFFKQKTAYEMRISDWSSDVCSSDLHAAVAAHDPAHVVVVGRELGVAEPASGRDQPVVGFVVHRSPPRYWSSSSSCRSMIFCCDLRDRKSVV